MTRPTTSILLVVLVPALAHGQSCVTGRIVGATTDQPIAGAAVSAAWSESNGRRLQSTKETISDSTGRYRLCLSRGGPVLLQASFGLAGAYLPITTPSADSTLADVRMPAEGDTGRAIVAGHVLGENGAPVEDANVTILGGRMEAPTGADGAYGLRAPEGSQVLIVRHVGLGAAVVAVNLSAQHPRLVNVSMQRVTPTLAVVNIVADRMRLGPVYDAIGLTARARDGHGHRLTADEIERKQAQETQQLFEGMPGVRLRYDHFGVLKILPNRGVATLESYGDCTAFMVDGALIGNGHAVYALDVKGNPQENDDETVLPKPGDLIAVEVYQPGEPSPVPPGIVDKCLKVVLWTKAMLPKP